MIKRSDYFRYHELLAMGIRDTELLLSMAYNAIETGERILKNSYIRHWPNNNSPNCPNCNDDYCVKFVDDNLCDEEEEGYYECDNCGWIISWWSYLENDNWHYTDRIEGLHKFVCNLKIELENPQRHYYYEQIGVELETLIQIVHGSGSMSSWFVQGGDMTISEFRIKGDKLL